MRKQLSVIVLISIFALGGCASPGVRAISSNIVKSVTPGPSGSGAADACPNNAFNIYFSDQLCKKYIVYTTGSTANQYITAADADSSGNTAEKIAFIHATIEDSRNKCVKFLANITGGQAAGNTAFDISSLLLSGLASVFTPVSTVRSLSAASTFFQGTKQALNTDVFQQLTMPLLVQQINTNYFKAMGTEFGASGAPGWSLSAVDAYNQIWQTHLNCSLTFAAGNINALQTGGAPATPPKTTLTVGGTFTAGDTIVLTAASASSGLSEPVKVPIVAGPPAPTAGSEARQIIAAIYADGNLASASIYAQPGTLAPAASAQLVIVGGPSDIKWTATVTTTPAGGAPTEQITTAGAAGS